MTTPNVTLMRDLVMIRPMPLALKKTADGIIVPGDIDKMSPKRATIVANGPGVYSKGRFIPTPFKVGDQVLYMERELIPTKIEGEDYFILKAEDVIVKIGETTIPEETLLEMSDGAYFAETIRRAVIARLKSCGLTRVQDMLNPTEIYIALDGNESVPVNARSFMVSSVDDINDWTPPDGMVGFAMHLVNFIQTGDEIKVVVRLGFLPRVDVTLG